jgi:hypothetical protein
MLVHFAKTNAGAGQSINRVQAKDRRAGDELRAFGGKTGGSVGNSLVILGRVVAGAVLGFLSCSFVWFPLWFAIAWIKEGHPPVLSEIPVGRFLTDPTWVLIIFSIPIIGALHGLVRGTKRRVPLHHIPWDALKGCFAALGSARA